MKKFGKNREVDPLYLNVPIKYILHYTGSNKDGKDKYGPIPFEEWKKTMEEWGDIVSEKLIIFENSTAFYNYIRGRRMVTAKWLYSNLILDKEDRDSVFFMSIKNVFKNKSDLVYWVDSRR